MDTAKAQLLCNLKTDNINLTIIADVPLAVFCKDCVVLDMGIERVYIVDYYSMIFKRKSFHLFRNTEKLSDDDISKLKLFIETVKPLERDIRYSIKLVSENETTCKRGAEYCIVFYSEEKGNYLRNIGYIGEQIDLWLAANNIGALWFGIGKSDVKIEDGMKFVIMIAISKMPESTFRKDMYKSKRKKIEEIWKGETLGIANVVRFAPSACNTQPWYVENIGSELNVYRYKKPGKRGIMPADKVRYYNRIDIGIFIFLLETCLEHGGISFTGSQMYEDEPDNVEKVLVARYKLMP